VAQTLEPLLGIALGSLVLADVFMLVLYARANSGLLSKYLALASWRGLVWFSRFFGRRRAAILAFAGPAILVLVLTSWALLMSLAVALVIHPYLGTGIKANHGATPTDFVTALYVGGSSLSIVSASDFTPQTAFFRLFDLLTSLIGISLVTLTVTYLMEVYSDLQARNALGLKVDLLSAQTGDAAEVVARLGPRGMFESGYDNLTDWAAEIAQVKESHHFYPILFYFRFKEPYYSVARSALTSLDTVTLIKSALDEDEYGWLKRSTSVELLWRGTLLELQTLAQNFIPKAKIDVPPDPATQARWERRFEAAVKRLQGAGVKTTATGAGEYVALRRQWDRYITLLAPQFAFEMGEIDTALAKL
jgi:hypothetical protein